MDNELLDLDLTHHQCGGKFERFFFMNNIKITKFTKYKSLENIPIQHFIT